MIHEVVYRMPPAPSSLAPPDHVSSQIEAVLAIALAKAPSDRFARAGDFAAAFAEAASGVLPASTADRAAAILRRTPWGAWIRGHRRASVTSRVRPAE
jgi:serine/threonine-protein kinase